jgi:pyruvate/2-oxoglutarate dehydrogenase complex dihydrolipoamide acyltransferase (E2) component
VAQSCTRGKEVAKKDLGLWRKESVEGSQAVTREVMTLSLTADHRIVDGAPGAQFLQTLVRLLEHPALSFAGREGSPWPTMS